VQARKPGDKVKLVLYRGGKKHTESATLEKAPARFGLFDDGGKSGEDMQRLEMALRELHGIPGAATAAVHAQTKALHEALRNISGPARSRADTRDTTSYRPPSFCCRHAVLLPGPFPTLEEGL